MKATVSVIGPLIVIEAGLFVPEEISSISLAPGNENAAALLLTLAPGNYIAVVRDAAGSTGVAQLETKELG